MDDNLYDGQHIESRANTVFAVTVAFAAFAFVVVALRIMSKAFVVKKVSTADWIIVCALVLAFGFSATICIGTRYGLGRHEANIPEEWKAPKQKARFAYTFLYNPALMATKTSILVFYLDLLNRDRLLRWGAWITLGVVNTAGFILTMLVLFQCDPIGAAFEGALPSTADCLNTVTLLYTAAPINVITDLTILVLPMPVLTSLRLPKKQKIILICVFAIGAFVSVVGIVRIHYFQKAAASTEFDWDGALSFMWASIEVNIGIICASIPMLKPLIATVMPSLLGLGTHETRSAGTGDLNASPQQSTSSPTPLVPGSTEFIRYRRPISAVKMSTRESVKPLMLVTILFFLWGMAYGLLAALNKEFEVLFDITPCQSLGLHGSYFGAYFFAPILCSGWILKKYGFKSTFMTGLCIYGCGCLIFWSSAVLESYAGFCISMTTVGFGLATLEAAANPFIALCGPPQFSEVRLNLAQGVQGVGGLCAPLLATKVLFNGIKSTRESLVDVQWVYLGIAFFVSFLALAFYYFEIPELSDDDFISPETEGRDADSASPWSPPQNKSFWKSGHVTGVVWGMTAMFMYCGAQEVVLMFARTYLTDNATQSPAITTVLHTAQGLFTAGRLISGLLMLFFKPRHILLIFCAAAVTCLALSMHIHGELAALVIVATFFFESCLFPTIFAMTLRGLGKWTKDVSGALVSSISGGSLFPTIYYVVYKKHNAAYAMCVPLSAYVVVMTLPVYMNVSKRQRNRLRVERAERVGLSDGCVRRRKGSRGNGSDEGDHIEMA